MTQLMQDKLTLCVMFTFGIPWPAAACLVRIFLAESAADN